MIGWINFAVTVVLCLIAETDVLAAYVAGALWATLVMALTHGLAYMIDKRADQVVGR